MRSWEAIINRPQLLSIRLKVIPFKPTAHLYHSTINNRPPQPRSIIHISTPSKPLVLTRRLIQRLRVHLNSIITPPRTATRTSALLAPPSLPIVCQRSVICQKTQTSQYRKICAINFSRMKMVMCFGSLHHRLIRYPLRNLTRLLGTPPVTWRRKFV